MTIIAFTIGNTKSYNEILKNHPQVYKTGKTEDYSGGIVWKTEQEAQNFLNSEEFYSLFEYKYHHKKFSIYKVILNDYDDLEPVNNKNYFYLLKDSLIMDY